MPQAPEVIHPTTHRQRIRTRSLEPLADDAENWIPGPKSAEALVAKTLRSLSIELQYEPTPFSFPAGHGFRPDFYLPTYDLYLEVTTSRNVGRLKRKRGKRLRLLVNYGKTTVPIGLAELRIIKTQPSWLLETIEAVHRQIQAA